MKSRTFVPSNTKIGRRIRSSTSIAAARALVGAALTLGVERVRGVLPSGLNEAFKQHERRKDQEAWNRRVDDMKQKKKRRI